METSSALFNFYFYSDSTRNIRKNIKLHKYTYKERNVKKIWIINCYK